MVSSELWFGAEASFYNNVVNQSLRFNSADSASLSWSPSSAGNRKKWTFSTWLKRSTITNASSGDQYIFSQATGTNNNDSFMALIFRGDDLDVTCHSLEVLRSDAKFRDVSAWYHILWVLDTENSTPSHRMRLYVNGDEITSFSSDQRSNSQLDGTNMPILNNATHYIGRYGGDTSRNFDGYLAYTELVEGEALTPSSFTETKNGVLIPKKYTGDHGTYGFRLEYKETGDGSSSPSTSTIGADTKSNATKQHWNDNNLDADDANRTDSPENNHATLNPLQAVVNDNSTKPTLSEGNLVMSTSTADYQGFSSTMAIPTEGKYAFKVKMNTESSSQTHRFGVGTSISGNGISTGTSGGASSWHNALVFLATVPRIDTCKNGTYSAGSTLSPATVAGDEIEFLVDMDNGTIDIKLNGSAYGTQITGMPTDKPLFPFGTVYESLSSTSTLTFTFDYTPSDSNYLTICTANLPEPTIGATSSTQSENHFGILTYSSDGNGVSIVSGGNDNNGTAIGGEISFQPDWVWIKRRNGSAGHMLQDSTRGSTKRLRSDNTDQEITTSTAVTSFDNNGFTLGTEGGVNTDTGTYVAWNWLAGGTTPSNTYKVVVVSDSGNKFRFRNSADTATFAQSAVTLNLQELGTYTFDVSDSSMSGHALKFSTTSDGIHGGGSEYTTGVTSSGTSGQSGAYVQITVASSAPTLYYYCGISGHSGMGGQINTNTTFGSTNFDGSILSIANVNKTAKFSIVTFVGNNTNDATIGHGLETTPEWIITKNRDDTTVGGVDVHWRVFHKNLTNDGTGQHTEFLSRGLYEVEPGGHSNGYIKTVTDRTYSTHASNVDSNAVNGSGDDMIAYCFAGVDGYSKFGKFIGNGLTDGTFIYLGFRPAFLIYKRIDTTGNWLIDDDVTQAFNPDSNYLVADTADQEGDTTTNTAGHVFDMLSNGFKMRNTNSVRNADGGTFIYIAFARQAFKYANSR